MEYHVLTDGWIKTPSEDFPLGNISQTGGRLLLGLNQLFVRTNGKNVLIDTGLGNKTDYTKFGLLDYQQPRKLITGLAELGLKPEDIDIVILSHLHYDHSGGGTLRINGSELAPTFTNSVYYVQNSEIEYARSPEPSRKDDFNTEDFEVLQDLDRFYIIDGDVDILSGLKVYLAPGHTPGHQVVIVEQGKSTVFFPGDLIPVKEHANSILTTGYDMDRKTLLKHRSRWLSIAAKNHWHCVFCHAVREPITRF